MTMVHTPTRQAEVLHPSPNGRGRGPSRQRWEGEGHLVRGSAARLQENEKPSPTLRFREAPPSPTGRGLLAAKGTAECVTARNPCIRALLPSPNGRGRGPSRQRREGEGHLVRGNSPAFGKTKGPHLRGVYPRAALCADPWAPPSPTGRGLEGSGRLIPVARSLALLFCSVFGLALAAEPALAQSFQLDLGAESEGSTASRLIQLVALITVLSLAPSILVMVTSFTRIVVVLSFLRSALGIQQTPPNSVLISLALFLTLFIMMPTLQVIYDEAIQPLIAEDVTEMEALGLAAAPVREFMLGHVREQDLRLFLDLSGAEPVAAPEETPMRSLIPAFMISELRRAFEIGFLLFLPFVIIDMVVASVLMSMGMLMLPPIMISLPFKLIFFVLVDGWYLVAGSLVQSYGNA